MLRETASDRVPKRLRPDIPLITCGKKSVDAEQTLKHMSALVGIGREIIVLLKCILGFLCIALVVLAYAMWRL